VLALCASLLIGVAVGKMAGGASDQSPAFDTSLVTDRAATPTPLPALPSPATPPQASPSATSGVRP
jgi:hypothetical protein